MKILRWLRWWFRPSGIFIALLGPDGVGKSTAIQRLIEITRPEFSGSRVYHWRPMLLFRQRHRATVTDPHTFPPRSGSASILRLVAYVCDYWFGYWFAVKVLVAKSNFVVFDRYYDDLLVDPKRYRYGGPLCIPRILAPLIPKPDLMFVLDAPNSVIASRKQELTLEEIQRQRKCYMRLAETAPRTQVVPADQDPVQMTEQFQRAIETHLFRRLKRPLASANGLTAASNPDAKNEVRVSS